jgi:hypothetical protein
VEVRQRRTSKGDLAYMFLSREAAATLEGKLRKEKQRTETYIEVDEEEEKLPTKTTTTTTTTTRKEKPTKGKKRKRGGSEEEEEEKEDREEETLKQKNKNKKEFIPKSPPHPTEISVPDKVNRGTTVPLQNVYLKKGQGRPKEQNIYYGHFGLPREGMSESQTEEAKILVYDKYITYFYLLLNNVDTISARLGELSESIGKGNMAEHTFCKYLRSLFQL